MKIAGLIIIVLCAGCCRHISVNDCEISYTISERIDKDVFWVRNPEEEFTICCAIEQLLENDLTPDAAVQIALLNNPEIQATFEELGISEADLIEAGLFKNPIFEGFVRFPFKKNIPLDTEFTILQSFLDVFLIPLRKKVAIAELEQTKLRVTNNILNIAFDVEETYYRYLAQQQKIAKLEIMLEAADAAKDLALSQRNAGNINELELQSRLNSYLLSQVELSINREELIELREKLNRLFGFDSTIACWRVSAEFPSFPQSEVSFDSLDSIALGQRLDLKMAQWEIDRLNSQIKTKPWWSYSNAELGPSTGRDTDGIRTWGGAFAAALPIFNYGQADRTRLSALIRQSFDRLRSKEIQILSELHAARDRLLLQRELVLSYQQQILLLQDQIVSLSQRYYNTMALSLYKALNAKVEEISTQINYTMALRDYWISRVTLARALGGDLPPRPNVNVNEVVPNNASDLSIEESSAKIAQQKFIPAVASNLAYNPVITPNGSTLSWELVDGVKVFHLIAEPCKRQFAPGMIVNCWGYNGQTPGPTIEAVEGDRVRIIVTNRLPEPTTVHWHGLILPNDMDGVSGLNQAPIQPGETFKYEFTLKQNGTFMYHSHFDDMTQIALGMVGFFIIHPIDPEPDEVVDRDFAIMLNEWAIPIGAATPDPMVMTDFNYFTFNSTVWPGTEPLVVKAGEKVRIRLGNLSMDSHPIHLHGYEFTITSHGGKRLNPSAQYSSVTVNVSPGETRQIEFIAEYLGDWAFHCHKSHHTMNGMQHEIPNLIGVQQDNTSAKIAKLLPHYHPMGSTGMGQMLHMQEHMHMARPPNYLPYGSPGPCGILELSGMFTVLKVRENITSYEDPGWFNCQQKR